VHTGYLTFSLKNLVLNDTTEKSMLGCARTLSEANLLLTLGRLSHSSEVWRSIHISDVAVSKERHMHLAEVGLKLLP